MKKITLAILMSALSVPAMADNWIKFKSQAVEDTINTIVAQECRQAAAEEYQKQMDQTTGKISVMGVYKVCSAACKDIRSNNGYSDCRYFINQMAEKSGFGTKVDRENCTTLMGGVWTLVAEGKKNGNFQQTYQCVGKDGHALVYKKSCDNAGGDCIKDFANLKTQGPVGREFIAEYARKKNLNLTCKVGFETRRKALSPLGQDYIMCSAGGKSYEFEFDSLNETPGKTSVESENKAMCEFFGGKIVKHPDSSVEKVWQSCDIDSETCSGKIHSLALRIGHNNMYQGYCRLSRAVQKNTAVFLNQIDGVDSYVFYKSGAQMRADMAKVQLEEYLRNTFPKESYINCDPTVKKFEKLGLDPDYLLTCTVGTKTVDFVFADLTEGNKKRADAGMDAMQCITNGGTFKGESCRGPTQDECTKLDAVLRARGSTEGAKWDDGVRACILGNAMKAYKQDVATTYIVGAVVIVGGTLVVIGTGGLATPVVAGGVEMLATDIAINYTLDWNHRRLSKAAANRFGDFLSDAGNCTDEQCAYKILEKHYASLSGVIDDLNKDDQAVVEETIDRLIGLIKTEFVLCINEFKGTAEIMPRADCAMENSTLRAIDYIDKVSEPVLIIGSIAYPAGFVTSRFMKLKNISKVAKTMNVSYKEARQMVKAGDVLHDATAVATKADDAATGAVVSGKNIKDPKLWKPGEDVADYMDIDAIKIQLAKIDEEDAAYIAELESRKSALATHGEQTRWGGVIFSDDIPEIENEYKYIDGLLIDAKATKAAKKNKILSEAIPEEVLETLRQSRHDDVYRIIASDEGLYDAAKNYEKLSATEREDFLQRIGDKLGETYFPDGKIKYGVVKDDNQNLGGYYWKPAKRININSNYRDSNMDKLVDIVIHENGHAIDDVRPLDGALGSLQDLVPETKDLRVAASMGVDHYTTISLKDGFGLAEYNLTDLVENDRQLNKVKDVLKESPEISVKQWIGRDSYFDRYLTDPSERSSHTIMKSDGSLMDNVERIRQQSIP